MEEPLKLTAWSQDGTRSQVLDPASLSWGGTWRDCARSMQYTVSPDSVSDLGGSVELSQGGEVLFRGTVARRGRSDTGHRMEIRAYDRGLWLKHNSTYLAVRGQTPETVAAQICQQFGIPVETLAAAGVSLNRNFFGTSLYQIIQTMYTLASEQNQKKYQLRFRRDRLEVVEKAIGKDSLRLETGVNILTTDNVDSIENMVNQVGIFDRKGRQVASYGDTALQALYGIFQRAIGANKREDPAAQARDILAEGGVKTTISADCLGSGKLLTGNAVAVHEPVTGLDGQFWIMSDRHTVKNGIWTTRVELDFRNLMDRQQAGSLPTR